MKLRVKYIVTEAGRFLGHLDLTRTIMKTLRRADFPVMFSEGFNPHPKLSFAMPLSVGHTADGEYFEIVLTEEMNPEVVLEMFNRFSPQAIRATEVKEVKEKQDSMSSQINCAIYEVSFPVAEKEKIITATQGILTSDSIVISKTSKRKTKEMDIRPLIYDLQLTDSLQSAENQGRVILKATISHGSKENLKISDLLGLYKAAEQEVSVEDALIKREGLYVKEEDRIRSLMDF